MWKLLAIAASLLVPIANATVPPTSSEKAYYAYKNVAQNPGFEQGKTGWTASGGTFTITTTAADVAQGAQAASWDSNAASQTLTGQAITIDPGLYGQACELTLLIKCSTGTCTHEVSAWNGSTEIAKATITSVSTYFPQTLTFTCPSSGTWAPRIKSIASNEPTILAEVDYMGRARTVGQINQATLVGTAYIPGTASCNWSRTSSTLGAFTTTAACPGPTVEYNPGPGAIQTTDSDLPRVTVNSLPAGRYRVVFHTYAAKTTAGNAYLAINDGTTTGNDRGFGNATDSANADAYVVGWFEYTNTANRTFELYGANTAGNGVSLVHSATGLNLGFEITRFPSSSETAFNPNLLSQAWSGYHDFNCSWTTTGGLPPIDPAAGDASCTFTESINRNFGSVTSFQIGGNNGPGIVWTPKRTGLFKVEAFTYAANSTSFAQLSYVRLSDGTTTIADGEVFTSGTIPFKIDLAGLYSVTDLSAKTIKLQIASSGGSTNTLSSPGTPAPSIIWVIYPIDQALPMPIVPGSVSSNSTGPERLERLTFGGSSVDTFGSAGGLCTSSPCTIWRQSGSWISSVTRGSTGNYTVNIASGIFTAPPTCNFTCNNGVTNTGIDCLIQGSSATSLTLRTRNAADSADIDAQGWLQCVGPR